MCSLSLDFSISTTHTHTHARPLAHSHSHAHTHTHTHTCSLSPKMQTKAGCRQHFLFQTEINKRHRNKTLTRTKEMKKTFPEQNASNNLPRHAIHLLTHTHTHTHSHAHTLTCTHTHTICAHTPTRMQYMHTLCAHPY